MLGEREPARRLAGPAPTVRDRLQGITPETPWGIDLEGKVRFLGITLDGTESPSGFTARYSWEVTEDLDARDYHVEYRYYGADGSPIYREGKTLFPNPSEYGENLDGGIGTVLTHWHYLPFPREVVGEVRILVRQKRKGKFVPPPLRSISGDRWLILGLPTDFFEKNT